MKKKIWTRRRLDCSKSLLGIIKKLVYTGGTNNLNIQHTTAMSRMNLMMLYQEKFQVIQDQYIVMKKACDELGLKFKRCEDYARAMLKEKGITEPTTAQLEDATDKIEEEHHAILFLYKMDRSNYGKLIEEMENDILQRKDSFPNACRVLVG